MSEKRIKVLVAKKKIDVHGRGSKLIAQELRDAGMEVVYFRFGVPEEIAEAAAQEDVDVVAVSIMTSGQMQVARGLVPALKERGMDDVLIIMGGIIPEVDFEPLREVGVHRSFPPGLAGGVVAEYIRENVGSASPA